MGILPKNCNTERPQYQNTGKPNMSLFKLRGTLNPTQSTLLAIGGVAFILFIWHLITAGENPVVEGGILPGPWDVLLSFGDLYRDNELIKNVARSLGFNIGGYVEALVIALPLGFIIGLFPFFRGSLQRPIDAVRYVPLPAAIGLFIAWFGIGWEMKVHFLAFGILIYLLPVVVQRIDEVKEVYTKTVYTLGATDWQTIKTVYVPSVLSRLSDDIRVLTAISWTYIIIAESIGGEGGIGALIWRGGQRQGRIDKVFALLIIIILIGILQDKLFTYLDREFFPHKYQQKDSAKRGREQNKTIVDDILNFAGNISLWIALALYFLLFIMEFVPIMGQQGILSHLFGEPVVVIHGLMVAILGYKIWKVVQKG